MKLAILAEDEYQALIDDVVAAGVEIAAIPLQVLEDIAIKLDGDLVPIFLGLLGNERRHLFTPLRSDSRVKRSAWRFASKNEGQGRERPSGECQRAREVSGRLSRPETGVALQPLSRI